MARYLDPRMIDSSKTAVTFTASKVITLSGDSDLWNAASTLVQANSSLWEESADITSLQTFIQTNSASWEESADVLPTITNYLSTELVTVSSLNVTEQLLSANNDLFSLFLTPANTLTTSVCAMSGNGATPFTMQFTKGLLTSITF
jgi:hypothetical protein